MLDVMLNAIDLLDDLGIKAGIDYGYLYVNRTSMVQFSNAQGEQAAYDEVLLFLRGEFPEYRISWGGRTDDHMLAIFYKRDK